MDESKENRKIETKELLDNILKKIPRCTIFRYRFGFLGKVLC